MKHKSVSADQDNTSLSNHVYIGIDLGTSGCRAIAIDSETNIVAEFHFNYADKFNQTPECWWSATQTVLREILLKINPRTLKSIAINATSGSVLLCDAQASPLTEALMYNDQRARKQAEFLKQHITQYTSQYPIMDSIVLNPSSGLAKVLWLLDKNPDLKDSHIYHQADWVTAQLSQSFDLSDRNNALKTGYDSINNNWPDWIKALLKSRDTKLPEVLEPGSVISNISPQQAKLFSLPNDVKIISGTTDSTAAVLASGAIKPGQAVTSLGSTLVIKVVSLMPINNSKLGIYSQPYGKYWLVGGASNTGGAVLAHYFSPEQLQKLSQKIQPEIPTQLDYYPLLTAGERFPINDPDYLPRITPKVENDVIFLQGLLEGIAEIEYKGYQLLHELGAPYPESVLSTGGGAINETWSRIRALKLGIPVLKAIQSDAAFGSAILALKHELKKEKINDQ